MNILIIQEAGSNPPNVQYKEAQNFRRAFQRLGVDSVLFGPGYGQVTNLPTDIDAALLLENYDRGWVPDLSAVTVPKLFWSVDSHKCIAVHKLLCQRHGIDVILCAVYAHVEKFRDAPYDHRTIFFPNAYPADLFADAVRGNKIRRDVSVGFCGCVGNRREWLEMLTTEVADFKKDIFVLGDDMVRAIASYQIHWNRNESIDINARTFETLGAGAMLLTNRTQGIDTLFKDGKDIVIYNSVDDCMDKIDYYAAHDREREAISAHGYEWASLFHTYDARASNVLSILRNL